MTRKLQGRIAGKVLQRACGAEPATREVPSGIPWLPLRDWPDALSALVALGALCLCLRAQGDPFTWLLLAALLPGLRLLISADYRERVLSWLRRQWSSAEDFAAEGGRVPWMAAVVFAALPALALYLFDDRCLNAVDTLGILPTAHSIVREGNWNLDEYVPPDKPNPLPEYLRRSGEHVYARWPVGMAQFALPVTAAAHLLGADFARPETYLRLEKWTAAWLAAACVALFFLLALHLAPPAPALAVTFVLAAGSALYSTVATALWHQDGIVLGSLVLLLLEFRQARRPSWSATLVQGVVCGSMLPCRLTSAVFIAALGTWVLLRALFSSRAGWWRLPLLVLVAALVYAPWVYLYSGMNANMADPLSVHRTARGWRRGDILIPLAGVLFSPARGLLVYQPWILLLGALAFPWVRRRVNALEGLRRPAGWLGFCLAALVAHILMISSWWGWWGGACWGSRLASEVVPLLALLCVWPVAALWQAQWGRGTVVAVGLVSFFLHVSAVHFYADAWNDDRQVRNNATLWSWSDPPFLYLNRR